jgi:hypothetical protein
MCWSCVKQFLQSLQLCVRSISSVLGECQYRFESKTIQCMRWPFIWPVCMHVYAIKKSPNGCEFRVTEIESKLQFLRRIMKGNTKECVGFHSEKGMWKDLAQIEIPDRFLKFSGKSPNSVQSWEVMLEFRRSVYLLKRSIGNLQERFAKIKVSHFCQSVGKDHSTFPLSFKETSSNISRYHCYESKVILCFDR